MWSAYASWPIARTWAMVWGRVDRVKSFTASLQASPAPSGYLIACGAIRREHRPRSPRPGAVRACSGFSCGPLFIKRCKPETAAHARFHVPNSVRFRANWANPKAFKSQAFRDPVPLLFILPSVKSAQRRLDFYRPSKRTTMRRTHQRWPVAMLFFFRFYKAHLA